MDEQSDEILFAAYCEGESIALKTLLERHMVRVYRFAHLFHPDESFAEDVVQETFIKVWRYRDRFDPKKKFSTWMYQIAKNTALDHLKKKRMLPFSSFEAEDGTNILVEGLRDPEPLQDALFEKAEREELLSLALKKLSHEARTVVVLRHVEDLTFREIGEMLGEPLDTVKSRYVRAVVSLRKTLEKG